MKTLTIFVSSPGDVEVERDLVRRIIEKLQARYWNFIRLEPVLWEEEPLRATATFQKEIIRPSTCDIVIGILWNRLGSPLPAEYTKADGGNYSGTEWELCEAVAGFEKRAAEVGYDKAHPQVLVYRRTSPRTEERHADDEAEAKRQAELLREFEQKFLLYPDGTARRSHWRYEDPTEFEAALENHLEKLICTELANYQNSEGYIPTARVSGSPFKGLEAFDVEDANLFYGRSRAISDVLKRLKSQHDAGNAFVMIYGSSGFGKSSLMRAGVAPRLIEPGYIPNTDAWRWTAHFPARGDGGPCESLARAILSSKCLPEMREVANQDKGGNWDVARLARALQTAPRTCFPALSQALLVAATKDAKLHPDLNRSPRGHLCLMVDQFEELFSHREIDQEQRENFFNALGILSTHPQVWIIATMRSEYFPHLSQSPALRSLTEDEGGYLLAQPELSELNQMIRYPAMAAGLSFETDPVSKVNLSSRLFEDMIHDPGALPLLQFCLEQLYARRAGKDRLLLTWEAYRQIGGLKGSISTVAQKCWDSLSDNVRNNQNQFFSELVTVSENEGANAVRRNADFDLLANQKGTPVADFLNAFVEAKLLTTGAGKKGKSGEAAKKTVRLTHEALISHWPVLKEWVEDNQSILRSRRRFKQQVADWLEQDKDPKGLLNDANLQHAREVSDSGIFRMTEDEETFLRLSEAKSKRILWLTRLVALVFFVLFGISGVLGYQADLHRKEAVHSRGQADEMNAFMIGRFFKQVEKLGEIGLLEELVSRVEEYVKNNPPSQWDAFESSIRMRLSQARIRREVKEYDKAEAILRDALEELVHTELSPDQANQSSVLRAEILLWLGDVLSFEPSTVPESVEKLLESQQILDGLSDQDERVLDLRVRNLLFLGDSYRNQKDYRNALNRYEQSLALAENISAIKASDPIALTLLDLFDHYGGLLIKTEDYGEAGKLVARMRVSAEAFLEEERNDVRFRSHLGSAYMRTIELYNNDKNLDLGITGMEAGQKAVKAYEKLVDRDPRNSVWRTQLVNSQRVAADFYNIAEDYDQAVEYLESGLENAREIVSAEDNSANQEVLFYVLRDLAFTYRCQDDYQMAIERFDEAVTALETIKTSSIDTLSEALPEESGKVKKALASTLLRRVDVGVEKANLSNREQALAKFERDIIGLRRERDDHEVIFNLSVSLTRKAAYQLKDGDLDGARQSYLCALYLLDSLMNSYDDNRIMSQVAIIVREAPIDTEKQIVKEATTICKRVLNKRKAVCDD